MEKVNKRSLYIAIGYTSSGEPITHQTMWTGKMDRAQLVDLVGQVARMNTKLVTRVIVSKLNKVNFSRIGEFTYEDGSVYIKSMEVNNIKGLINNKKTF